MMTTDLTVIGNDTLLALRDTASEEIRESEEALHHGERFKYPTPYTVRIAAAALMIRDIDRELKRRAK